MVSEFKVLFFLLLKISGARFSQAGKNLFSVQSNCVLFSGLYDDFEDGALRNLMFLLNFYYCPFFLKKNVSQDLLSATFLFPTERNF